MIPTVWPRTISDWMANDMLAQSFFRFYTALILHSGLPAAASGFLGLGAFCFTTDGCECGAGSCDFTCGGVPPGQFYYWILVCNNPLLCFCAVGNK